MALEGELDIAKVCPDCKRPMPVKVCRSGAGYYIGQYCDYCGPYNRLSYNYYRTQEEAEKLLETGKWKPRDTNYHPGPITIIGVKRQQCLKSLMKEKDKWQNLKHYGAAQLVTNYMAQNPMHSNVKRSMLSSCLYSQSLITQHSSTYQ